MTLRYAQVEKHYIFWGSGAIAATRLDVAFLKIGINVLLWLSTICRVKANGGFEAKTRPSLMADLGPSTSEQI